MTSDSVFGLGERQRAGEMATERLSAGWLATRLAIGSLLLIACLLKALQLATVPLLEDKGLFSSRWLLVGAAEGELLLGLWLVFGIAPQLSRVLGLILLLGFACVSAIHVLAGEEECGCLGQVPVKSWQMLLVDLTAIGALLGMRPGERSAGRGLPVSLVVTAAGLGLGAWLALVAMNVKASHLDADGRLSGEPRTVVLDPEKWVGHRLPLLPYVRTDANLGEGEWIIVLYRAGCGRCHAVIKKTAQERAGPRVALIELPPYGGGGQAFASARPLAHGRLSAERDWFAAVPILLSVEEGLVKRVTRPEEATLLEPKE